MKTCKCCEIAFVGPKAQCDDCQFTHRLAGKLIGAIALNGAALGWCSWLGVVSLYAGHYTTFWLCTALAAPITFTTTVFTKRLYRL